MSSSYKIWIQVWIIASLITLISVFVFHPFIIGVDDNNYLNELNRRGFFNVEFSSWYFLKGFVEVFGSNSSALRLAGLFILCATLIVVKKRFGVLGFYLFTLSVTPYFVNIYFNQLRLAFAILIVLALNEVRGKFLAITGHISSIIFLISPIQTLVLTIFVMLAINYILQDNLVVEAYLSSNNAPLYLGWELVILAVIRLLIFRSRRYFTNDLIFLSIVLYMGHFVSVAAARRVLEIFIILISPFWCYTADNRRSTIYDFLFIIFGLFQISLSINSGVVKIGGV